MRLFHIALLSFVILFLSSTGCHRWEEINDGDEPDDDDADYDYPNEDLVDLDYARHVRDFYHSDLDREEQDRRYPESDLFHEEDPEDEEKKYVESSEEDTDNDGDGERNDSTNRTEGDVEDDNGDSTAKDDEDAKASRSEDEDGGEDEAATKAQDEPDAESAADTEAEKLNEEGHSEGHHTKDEKSSNQDKQLNGWQDGDDKLVHRFHKKDHHKRKPKNQGSKACETKACVIAAAEVLRNMNLSANPCDDFYNYACGHFPDNHQIQGFQGKLHSFAILRQRVAYDLHNVIQKLDVKTAPKILKGIKLFYSSCLDLTRIGKTGDEPQINLVKKYFIWPIKGSEWPGQSWSLKSSLKSLAVDLGVHPLFLSGITLDDKKATQYIFKFTAPELGLPKSYYHASGIQQRKTVEAYLRLIVKLFRKYGLEEEVDEAAREVYEFEKEIAKIKLPDVLARNIGKIYKKLTISDLDNTVPEVGVKDILTAVYSLAPKKVTVTGLEKVVVLDIGYFTKLSQLLKKTKASTVAKYLIWNVISFLGHFGPSSTQDLYQEFRSVYLGTDVSVPRWKSCLGTVSSGPLGMVIGREYVESKFNKENKGVTSKILPLIQKEFLYNLRHIDWMDSKTKEGARRKVKKMVSHIGYPNWILDDKAVARKFKGLYFSQNDFMGNFFKLQAFGIRKELELLIMKKRNRNRWTTSPAIVNAFYSETFNRIVFPAGILQPPFVDSSFPMPLNFGGIGTVVGHELTHAFDDNGRKYDEYGNLRSWWTAKAAKAFTKRADCIRRQYSSYEEYNAHVNGALTAGENIADNGGVKLAFRAMKRALRQGDQTFANFNLPGLEKFTNDQLFFLGFSRLWCTVNRKEFTLQRIATDPHTMSKFRVIGVLSNMKEFANAFHCPLGSPMNPKKKCSVW